jgi:hypothetical protein
MLHGGSKFGNCLAQLNSGDSPRYEPYWIAFRKTWLFEQGGRPVIYQPDAEYDELLHGLLWRHCRYEPTNRVDFTREREWRIPVERLPLDPRRCLVVVPAVGEAFDIMTNTGVATPSRPKWLSIALSFLGLEKTGP